jgi:hypothetical protein
MPAYDLLVYHDLCDYTENSGDRVPSVGDAADGLFGDLGKDRYVVAVGPGIHEGRITVVVGQRTSPMRGLQALLDTG